jgi:hypothetical protein
MDFSYSKTNLIYFNNPKLANNTILQTDAYFLYTRYKILGGGKEKLNVAMKNKTNYPIITWDDYFNKAHI